MAEPTRIADRYQVHELLGRGGMASVYRVTDSASGRALALKQLLPAARNSRAASIVALFEHEFHTLKELRHPRVIAVYDYGVDGDAPYYTMELLDGGDLLARAPVPWRELCALMFDVCSSLALLHSRRLLHRDINPRNIRCTQDGKAKLIDFGAMAGMSSGGAQVVGTPAFTPPETLHRLATDARADLFSLGATFYAALTGQLAYPARTFAELVSAWEIRPQPPSARVPDLPAALDDLILSLLSLDPALRPQSAFDVMQRLAAIAGLDGQESVAVSRAYLSTPALVGRDDVLGELRAAIEQAGRAQGSGIMLRGAAGVGRSRALDACAMAAMTQGALVLRATASGNPARFAVAWELLKEVLYNLPRESIPG
ncbi:MAG TPA: serine/threonine-protein kinase, partial [Polyangiales bacterium]|nr:serine/threonine-protein kinase [Polyangiales bacterium]